LEEVVTWVTEQSGLNIPSDQLEFDIYDNARGRPNCQGKIAYRGPVSPTSGGLPKIKLDLTADERLVLSSVRREVFHPYTDKTEGGIWANCYAYEQAFGEKLRALGERTRPRDLYDVVNLYRHTDSRPSAAVLLDVLRQKCDYKAIPVPTFASLMPHHLALEAMWSDMLSHQLPVLPPLNDFWGASGNLHLDDERRAGSVARDHPTRCRRSGDPHAPATDRSSPSCAVGSGNYPFRSGEPSVR
jgi:hypothetical protein